MTNLSAATKYDLLMDGQLIAPKSGKYFDAINPSTGETLAKIASAGLDDVKKAVLSARHAFDEGPWPRLSVAERGEFLSRIAKLIRENAKVLSEYESLNTGKTIKQTTFIDVPTCADTFEYFARAGESLKDEKRLIAAPVESLISHEPMGAVATIIPWNYPLIMTAWKIAPALLAGNTVVHKPSRLGSLAVMKLSELIKEAGLPAGVVNILTGDGSEIGCELAKNRMIDMISFTGGTETGRQVMSLASGNVKKVCLELGGKSPQIVFSDSDPEAALGAAMSAIFMNQGQMCVAGSRLLLEDAIYDSFVNDLVERTKKLKIGNSLEYETDFGPLISREHRDNVLKYIEAGKQEGARLVCGGNIPLGAQFSKGFFLEPTIFADVLPRMTIAKEEIFGPVLSVIKFSGEEEAVKMANDTAYGLAAMIWTKDNEKARRVAHRLRCGTVWINTYGGFYNEAPYGGYKQSGFGRELGIEGLLEYTQTKHICRDQTPGGKPLVSGWF